MGEELGLTEIGVDPAEIDVATLDQRQDDGGEHCARLARVGSGGRGLAATGCSGNHGSSSTGAHGT